MAEELGDKEGTAPHVRGSPNAGMRTPMIITRRHTVGATFSRQRQRQRQPVNAVNEKASAVMDEACMNIEEAPRAGAWGGCLKQDMMYVECAYDVNSFKDVYYDEIIIGARICPRRNGLLSPGLAAVGLACREQGQKLAYAIMMQGRGWTAARAGSLSA